MVLKELFHLLTAGSSTPTESRPPKTVEVMRVEAGSNNAEFKRKASGVGDAVAREVAVNLAGAAAHAVVGRVPVVGPGLSMAARDVARQELKDVKVFKSDTDQSEPKPKLSPKHRASQIGDLHRHFAQPYASRCRA